jgi:hypothetical protein
MSSFAENVTKLGGQHKSFDQNEVTNKLSKEFSGGACFGISTLFLARFDKDKDTDEEVNKAHVTFSKAVADPKVREVVSQVQRKEHVRSQFSEAAAEFLDEDMAELKKVMADLDAYTAMTAAKADVRKAVVLTPAESDRLFDDLAELIAKVREIEKKTAALNGLIDGRQRRLAAVCGYGVMLMEALGAFGQKKCKLLLDEKGFDGSDVKLETELVGQPGRYLISLGNHAVAALCSPKKWKFFDPNEGQAIFDKPEALKKFVRAYLNDADNRKAYKIAKGKIFLAGATL